MNFKFLLKWKLIIIIYIFLCFGVGIGLGYFKVKDIKSDQITDSKIEIQKTENTTDKSIPTPPANLDELLTQTTGQVSANSKHLSVLLLGYGGAGHDGGYLSDTIILVYLDVVKKKLVIIHIPRDLWVNVKIGENIIPMKINSALAMGTKTSNYPTTTVSKDVILRASTLTKQAVTTATGLPIDFVVSVDFNNFTGAINSLKGIDVKLQTAFDDPWYPVKGRELELCGHSPEDVTAMSATMSGFNLEKQFPCRYEHLHFNTGINHMDGETALKFSRSRHTSSDFDRGMRQIAVVRAVVNKLFTLDALNNIKSFYDNLTKSVKTDISVDQLNIIAPILKTIPDLEVVEIGLDNTNVLQNGTSSGGAYILMPKEGDNNWDGVKKYVEGKI
ncbi:MAG: hypothetical protein GYA51_14840 [Candidatus Methanofastidiosa archaeon]|nr:hypothetical protein [Candidatus Methanofastidiosa archaeon]